MHYRTRLSARGRPTVTATATAVALTLTGCASTLGGGEAASTTAAVVADTSSTIPAETTASTAAASSQTTAAASGTAAGSITDLPEGWNVISGPKASLGAPVAWLDLRPLVTDPAARAAFEQSVRDQSTSAVIDSIAPELLDQIDVMAIDGTTSATGFATTLNVIVDASGLVTSLDTMDALVGSQLQAVGAELQTTSRATIGGIDTLVVDYSITTPQSVTATGRQYYQKVNDAIVTVTFTALPGQVDYALWDQIVGTLTVSA